MSIEKKIKITLDASSAKKGLDDLATRLSALSAKTNGAAGATGRYSKANKTLNQNLINTNRSLNAMQSLLVKIASAATIVSGIRLADDFNELQNKIRITAQEGEDLLEIQDKLVDVSLRTRTSLKENALLYLRLSNAVDRTSVSQKELFRITETVGKAIQIGGSSAQEAQGALRQFTQIVSSGFVSGFSQELNSLIEQTPGLFNVLEDGLREVSSEFRELEESGLSGIKILKTFSEEGLGDIDLLLSALATQYNDVNQSFEKVTVTVSKALGNVRTALEEYIGKADDASGFTENLANAINDVALNFDEYAARIVPLIKAIGIAASAAGGLMISKFVASLYASIGAMVATGRAAKTLTARLIVLAGPAGLVAGAAAAILAFAINSQNAADRMTDLNKTVVAFTSNLNGMSAGLLIQELESVSDNLTESVDLYRQLNAEIESLTTKTSDPDLEVLASVNRERLPALVAEQGVLIKEIQILTARKNDLLDEQEKRRLAKARASALELISTERFKTFKKLKIEKEFNDRIFALTEARDVILNEKAKEQAQKIIDELIRQRDEELKIKGKYSQKDLLNLINSFKSERQLLIASADEKREIVNTLVADESRKADLILKINEQLRNNLASLNENQEGDAISSRLQQIKDSLKSEIQLIKERYAAERKFISDNVTSNIEASIIKSGLREKEAEEIKALLDNLKESSKEEVSLWEKIRQAVNAVGNAFTAFTDLFATLSSIRQDKIDEELSTSTDMSDEERKTKEANAKKAFETSKRLTLAGIAMQTGLAIMNALSDTEVPFFIRAANAVGAAAMGAAQYAKANSQSYTAPTPPSASSIQGATSNETVNNTQVTVNITGGDPNRVAQQLVEAFDNNELTFENGRFNSV